MKLARNKVLSIRKQFYDSHSFTLCHQCHTSIDLRLNICESTHYLKKGNQNLFLLYGFLVLRANPAKYRTQASGS